MQPCNKHNRKKFLEFSRGKKKRSKWQSKTNHVKKSLKSNRRLVKRLQQLFMLSLRLISRRAIKLMPHRPNKIWKLNQKEGPEKWMSLRLLSTKDLRKNLREPLQNTTQTLISFTSALASVSWLCSSNLSSSLSLNLGKPKKEVPSTLFQWILFLKALPVLSFLIFSNLHSPKKVTRNNSLSTWSSYCSLIVTIKMMNSWETQLRVSIWSEIQCTNTVNKLKHHSLRSRSTPFCLRVSARVLPVKTSQMRRSEKIPIGMKSTSKEWKLNLLC